MKCPKCDGEMNKYFDKQLVPHHKCFRCGYDSKRS